MTTSVSSGNVGGDLNLLALLSVAVAASMLGLDLVRLEQCY